MYEEYVALSDEDSEEDTHGHGHRQPPELQGTVSKWTNYIHGWQNRYMVLKDGTMSYYRNQNETAFGCRGSISVKKAHVRVRTPLVLPSCSCLSFLVFCFSDVVFFFWF
uniref:PH domain-containing protein n=1 Tax=Scylla olivacea TaxID=85551 RepID=A0A0P4WGZ2_SCYOL